MSKSDNNGKKSLVKRSLFSTKSEKETERKTLPEKNNKIEKHNKSESLKKDSKQKEQESREKKIEKEKQKLYETVPKLLADSKQINNIVKPLAEEKGKKQQEEVGLLGMARAGANVLEYAASHGGDLKKLYDSKDFYKDEAAKLLDPNKAKESFFVKVIDDDRTPEFLETTGPQLSKLVEETGSTLVSAGFRQAGRLEDAEKKLSSIEKQLAETPNYQDRLEELKNKEELSKTEQQELADLDKKVDKLNARQAVVRIAKVIRGLENNGLDSNTVANAVIPTANNILKVASTEPQATIKLAKVGIGTMHDRSDNKLPSSDNKLPSSDNKLPSSDNKLPSAVTKIISQMPTDTIVNVINDLAPPVANIASNIMNDEQVAKRLYNDVVDNIHYASNPSSVTPPDITRTLVDVIEKDDVKQAVGNLGNTIATDRDRLTQAANKAIDTPEAQEQLGQLGVSKEMAQGALPVVLDVTSSVLGKSDEITKIYKNTTSLLNELKQNSAPLKDGEEASVLRDFIGDGKPFDDVSKKNLQEIATGASSLLQDERINKAITADLPEYLQNNKEDLEKAISFNLHNNDEIKKTIDDLGLSDAGLKTIISNGVDVATEAIPTVTKLAEELTKDPEKLTDLIDSARGVMAKNDNALDKVIDNLDQMPEVKSLIQKDLGTVINTQQTKIEALASETLNTKVAQEQLKQLGVSKEMVQGALPVVQGALPVAIKASNAILPHTEDLIAIQKASRELRVIDGELTENQQSAIKNATSKISTIITDKKIKNVIEQDIPEYLNQYQENIVNAAWITIQNDEKLKKKYSSIDRKLMQTTVTTLTPVIKQSLPIATKVIDEMAKDAEGMGKLIAEIQQASKEASTKAGISDKTAMKAVSVFFEMQKNSPELKSAVQQELPNVIRKNAKPLAKLMDDYLQKTEFGPKLKLDSEKALEIMADKMPEISKVAENYAKGNTVRALIGAAGIVMTPKVFGFAVKTRIRYALHQDKNKSLADVAADVSQSTLQEAELDNKSQSALPEVESDNKSQGQLQPQRKNNAPEQQSRSSVPTGTPLSSSELRRIVKNIKNNTLSSESQSKLRQDRVGRQPQGQSAADKGAVAR